jgi:hypothetical protein
LMERTFAQEKSAQQVVAPDRLPPDFSKVIYQRRNR